MVSCPDHTVYLDYRQSESADEPIPVSMPLTLEDTYGFEPVPEGLTEEQAAGVRGGQANLWTEHIDSPRMVDYYAFPRLCAIAEALWTEGERDFADFLPRLERRTWPASTRWGSSTAASTARCPGRPVPACPAGPPRAPSARRTPVR